MWQCGVIMGGMEILSLFTTQTDVFTMYFDAKTSLSGIKSKTIRSRYDP